MRRSSGTLAFLTCVSALALTACGQQASTPATTGQPIGAAASDAEAQAAADARSAELAAREKELADREAALAAQEQAAKDAADAKAKAEAEAAAATAAAAEAAKAKKAATKAASSNATAAKPPAAPPKPIVVPAGTPVSIELAANVNTKKVHVGDPVQARLASDLVVDGRTAAKAGATVNGTVSQVVSGSDKIGGIPTLGLSFTSLVAADGDTKAINSSYVTQGKSETGRDTAKILGGAAAGAIIGHQVDNDDKGTVIGGLVGAGAGAAAARKTGGEIKLTAGQVLQVTTTASFEVKP
jgi:hypothetical protein